ncbi:MAG TPA: flippase [Azospirillaceae bacterium]|nr:flippase [Azospirillaceae bacterium]
MTTRRGAPGASATPPHRRLARNLGAMTLGKVVVVASGLVTTGWLARALGPENYGILGFGGALLAYFALMVNLGLSTWAVGEIARDPARVPRLAANILTLRLLLAGAVYTAYALVVATIEPPGVVRLVLLVQGTQLLAGALTLDFVYQGIERMGVIATREIGAAVFNMMLVVMLVRGPDDVVTAAAVTAAALVINALLMLARYIRDFAVPWPRIDTALWRGMLVTTAPLAVSLVAWAVHQNLDMVMLGFMAPREQVGLYAAAYKVLLLVGMVAGIVMNVFLPALASAHGDLAAMRRRMAAYATAMALVGAPMAAGGLLLAPEILWVVFGARFVEAAPALRLLMAAGALVFINMTLGNPLLVWHRQKAYMVAMLAGAVTNAALNIVLIPRWGIEGAAAATLAAEVVSFIGMLALHLRTVGRLPIGIFVRAATAIGVAAVAVLLLLPRLTLPPWSVFLIAGAVLIGIYGLLLPMTGLVRLSRVRALLESP